MTDDSADVNDHGHQISVFGSRVALNCCRAGLVVIGASFTFQSDRWNVRLSNLLPQSFTVTSRGTAIDPFDVFRVGLVLLIAPFLSVLATRIGRKSPHLCFERTYIFRREMG